VNMAGELDGPRLEPPGGQPAKRLVVFLHGYGADGNDLIDIGRAWQALLPDTAFVSPHAPDPCGQAPVGRVPNAVMFHAGLARGMTLVQVLAKTKSLGRKVEGSEDDWRWSDDAGASVVLHFERGRLRAWQLERPDVAT